MTPTILVTGGTGFLGSYIIRELRNRNYQVRAIRRSGKLPFWLSEDELRGVEWVQGDVLDLVSLEDAMEGVYAVIHAAAMVSFVKKGRKEMYQVNVDGTANVVNMAIEKNIQRFVHISSVAAVGRTGLEGEVTEEKKWEESSSNTHYAISKHKGEMEVWRGMAEGLNGVILNPSTILGYGDWTQGSCAGFKTVYDGFPWYSTGVNGFVDVEDVARATVLLMESSIREERFIVNGENWPFKKLMDTIADNCDRKRPSRATTPFLMGVAWRLEKIKSLFSGKTPLLTRETAKVAMSKTRFMNDKILAALPGFSFTPLEQTIRAACQRYLATH